MMTEKPTPEMIDQWHHWFAIECNNRAWDLASKPGRNSTDDREMLNSAHAAAFHWSKVGKPVNDARSEMTLAHIHSLLGNGKPALAYARSCLAFFESNEATDWDIAFAHAEMAFAAAVAGDSANHAKHYARAKELGQAIKEQEDRTIFLEEFIRIPTPA